VREVMLRILTSSVWQRHPTAAAIRAVFGYIEEPTAAEARNGKRESYKVMYVYDFKLTSATFDTEKQ
jgi:hypothetical protein